MRILILLIVLAVSGCATVKLSELSTIDSKIGTVPNIGEQAVAPVGGVIYSQFRYWSKIGYRLKGDFSTSLGLGKVSVSDGDFVLKSEVENKTVFCTEKSAYIDPMVGPHTTACFIDADNDGKFERVKAAPAAIWFESEITPPLAYEKSELVIPRNDSFKYELLYQGISKGSLKLSYREYVNDFARPAFFQDVTYDLDSTPTTITFRTVRLEVLNANNNQISYRVLSGF
ncbi:MAG: hypothetical protein PHS51_08555 [Gallionella sp.]|nr:hypothetical protein [Gallionella sp.]